MILTSDIVREIRARYAAGETQIAIARHFGASKVQIHKVLTGENWFILPDERLCEECGEPGIEPSHKNSRKLHVACYAARRSRHLHRQNPESLARERAREEVAKAARRAERYATDPAYRERVDVLRLYSMRGRPYLEALSWRVLWSRYRLREEDFLRLLTWQQELCPCGEPFNGKPHVDHDHACCPGSAKSCGKCVRGLLHSPCNFMVGFIEKHPDVIEPRGWVAKYLAEPPYQRMLSQ